MKLIDKKCGTLLGYHITLGSIPGKNCVINIKNTAPYTAEVNILMPEAQKNNWYVLFVSAIVRIQNGKCWTLRMDKSNAYKYIGAELLNRFDKQFVQYPIVLYGGTDANSKANTHSLKMQQKHLERMAGA